MEPTKTECRMTPSHEEDETREKAYRIVAYTAIVFSLLSVMSVCLTVPLAYRYVSYIQQHTDSDVKFCQVCVLLCFFSTIK